MGAWISNVVLFLIGLYFLKKAQNDSRLFEADNYVIIFNRLKEKIKSSKLVEWLFNKIGFKLVNTD